MKKQLTLLLFILLASATFAQNGRIISKQLINLSDTPFWEYISENDTFTGDFDYLEELNFYTIIYQSDGFEVRGITIEPKAVGKYPVVIFNRGGNRNFAALSIGMMVIYTSKLAAQGYVIVGSNYRDQDEFGGSEINDVLVLTETIKEIENVDTTRIGMFGWSRGGMMTYLALQKSDKIKTAIIGNGPADMFEVVADRPVIETNVLAECVPDYWKNREAELKKRSVIYWVDELNKNTSILILCGTQDKRVNPKQADQIAALLTQFNYDFELQKYNTDHFFSDKKDELNTAVIAWFDERLKNSQ